jgi:uncharacterized YigZ family protein
MYKRLEQRTVKIIQKGASAEITEKKSRFIATVASVSSQEEADAFLASVKKKYWDARHNCSAMVLGERGEFTRCSDDGEPSGTAGRPMLAVLTGAELKNVCVVVTRYFGGVLLGTGGLVRAYSKAVQEGLNACTVAEEVDGFRLRIFTDYNTAGKVQYLLAQQNLPVTDISYTESVELETLVPADKVGALKEQITDRTNAKAVISSEEKVRYACADGTPVFVEPVS